MATTFNRASEHVHCLRLMGLATLVSSLLAPSLIAAEHTPEQIKAAREFVYAGVGWKDADSTSPENFLKLYPSEKHERDYQVSGRDIRHHFEADLVKDDRRHRITAEFMKGRLFYLCIEDGRPGSGTATYKAFVDRFGKPFGSKVVSVNLTHHFWELGGKRFQFELYYGPNQFGQDKIDDSYRVIVLDVKEGTSETPAPSSASSTSGKK